MTIQYLRDKETFKTYEIGVVINSHFAGEDSVEFFVYSRIKRMHVQSIQSSPAVRLPIDKLQVKCRGLGDIWSYFTSVSNPFVYISLFFFFLAPHYDHPFYFSLIPRWVL